MNWSRRTDPLILDQIYKKDSINVLPGNYRVFMTPGHVIYFNFGDI